MPDPRAGRPRRSHAELLQLERWNAPTIFNGWEQITRRDVAREGINLEETRDFMPQMGSMVGYAVTLVIQPDERRHAEANPRPWSEYCAYVASQPGLKIAVVQDLDKPSVLGSARGEVNANVHRALGCVGTITDGAIRDEDEMTNAGFKALARRLCVGHGYVAPVRWGEPVEVFGARVEPGQVVHADQHGFLAVPPEDEEGLLEDARFMDDNGGSEDEGESERHAEIAGELVAEVPRLAGNLLHDAHTGALMREHGVRAIYTRDTDFHRFPGIEVRDPLGEWR